MSRRVSPPMELHLKPSSCSTAANSKLTCTHNSSSRRDCHGVSTNRHSTPAPLGGSACPGLLLCCLLMRSTTHAACNAACSENLASLESTTAQATLVQTSQAAVVCKVHHSAVPAAQSHKLNTVHQCWPTYCQPSTCLHKQGVGVLP